MKFILENKLLKICSEALGVSVNDISVDDNLFDLGVNSIQIATILLNINSELDESIDIEKIWKYPTISKISDYIKRDDG